MTARLNTNGLSHSALSAPLSRKIPAIHSWKSTPGVPRIEVDLGMVGELCGSPGLPGNVDGRLSAFRPCSGSGCEVHCALGTATVSIDGVSHSPMHFDEWCIRTSFRLGELAPFLLMGFAVLLLSGCGATPAAPVLTDVDLAAAREILNAFVSSRSLLFGNKKTERRRRVTDAHKGFFVTRRAWWLLGHGPAAWRTEPGHPTIIARINTEFDALVSYTDRKLGTTAAPGSIMGGPGAGTPAHLDPVDLARQRTADPQVTVAQARAAQDTALKRKVIDVLTRRRERAIAIIWRAAGIHDELWQASADQKSAALREPAMNEVLDRRIHTVERMGYQIARADEMGGQRLNMSAGVHGPWTDGLRVRMFEYPRLAGTYAPNLGTIADEHGLPASAEWHWESARHRRVVYNVGDRRRIRDAATSSFPVFVRPDGSRYYHALQQVSGRTPAQAMEALFTPSTNFWDRSWLYCDHVVSSLHLMALLFGKRRRTGSDAAFNTLVTGKPLGYVQIGPVLHTGAASGGDRLMDSVEPNDPAFQNILADPADIQVGDHVIFWNSMLYPYVSNGEWQLENSLVVSVESDPERGRIDYESIWLQGHGTVAMAIGQYARKMIAVELESGLNEARQEITAAPAGTTALMFNRVANRLVKWAPYNDTWTAPGPWWVRIPIPTGATADQLLERLRKGVKPGPAFDNPPPFADSVYFPLWEPQYEGGWTGYLDARKSGPVKISQRLKATPADGDVLPGLHYTGNTWDKVPVVRPKVVP
jgi:hypothetical protein